MEKVKFAFADGNGEDEFFILEETKINADTIGRCLSLIYFSLCNLSIGNSIACSERKADS